MIVGIHPNKKYREFGYDTSRFIYILRLNGIQTELLYAGDTSFWDEISKCNLFIYQWTHHDYHRQIAQTIIPIIENYLKIKCFPNIQSSWVYDDKIKEYYLLKIHGFPFVDSWIFYDIENALRFIETANYPLVFKLKSGAGSQMVKLLRDKSMARHYIKLMFKRGISYNKGLPGDFYDQIKKKGLLKFLRIKLGKYRLRLRDGFLYYDEDWLTHKNYIIFQKFLQNNAYDTRVVVIGKRALAFQRYNMANDFRASGSNRVNFDPKIIDLRFIEIAFKISQTFGFDSMAYDFLYDENNQPAIGEISYIFGSMNHESKISKCPGFWDDKMNWHVGQTDVAGCILSTLLPDLNLQMI